MDATILVENAKKWKLIGPQISLRPNTQMVGQSIPPRSNSGLKSVIHIPDTVETRQLRQVEHVTVTVNIAHPYRGSLEIDLISPSGMISKLATRRKEDFGTRLNQWTFMTVANWGELPQGNWTLHVRNPTDPRAGYFYEWSMRIYGERGEYTPEPEPIPEPVPEPTPSPITNTSDPTTESNITNDLPPTPIPPSPEPDTVPISNTSTDPIRVIDANPALSYAKGTMENVALTVAAIGGLVAVFLTSIGMFFFVIRPQINRRNPYDLTRDQTTFHQESLAVEENLLPARATDPNQVSRANSEDRLTLYAGSEEEDPN